MSLRTTQIPTLPSAELSEAAIEQVRNWVAAASKLPGDKASARLSGLLQDPNGLRFAVGFVDGVIRPEDKQVAAKNLFALRKLTPKFLPLGLRALIRLGANFGLLLPGIVIPIARAALRDMVSHLVIDASSRSLGSSLRRIAKTGARLNINLLGEAVLGTQEANRRLVKTAELLTRKDIDYVSIKVSSATAPHSKWDFDNSVLEISERLAPLYEIALRDGQSKFINLDMEEYHDLDLTVAVFKNILGRPEFKSLSAGIVLQAYLPDALAAMIDLQQWAQLRTLAGGAPIKVRVVKGANLPMERVDAELHGWKLATVDSKAAADANYKRVLNYALTAERIQNVHIGVAGHNLFDLAYALLLAEQRGVSQGLDAEMLLGMSPQQAKVVQQSFGSLVLYTPVVHPQEFDSAIAYLIRRLEEGSSPENFLSSAFSLSNPETFELEKQRFLDSISRMDDSVPLPSRLQDRRVDLAVSPAAGFENAPDTDYSLASNRAWAKEIFAKLPTSTLGQESVGRDWVSSPALLDSKIAQLRAAGVNWGKRNPLERAEYLHRAGVVLERNRAKLIEVAMSETGKPFDQADSEVSEAVDFAHYYAERTKELAELDGAVATPFALTLVTPPWNFPIAIPAGGVLAALGAGSAVLIKPAGQAARCGALLADLLREVFPAEVLGSIQISESELGQQLISHEGIDQLILTGGFDTAKLFREFNPELRLMAETSGKNAIIVTPSADYDLAAKDIAYSAFGHAGQKCSAASIAILVGSVASSKRFRRQLLDAVQSLKIDFPDNPAAQMGPLVEVPSAKLLAGLTTLERGERWLMQPKQLDESGRLWSPGIKDRVLPGSPGHKVEYFGPVLAVMTAPSLEAAIALQNSVDYGLTAGLHSLDPVEIRDWLARVQAGNLYVNRSITGAIVERQPFGGWKRSAIGPTAKAGGPNYLLTLTGFASKEAVSEASALPERIVAALALAALGDLHDAELTALQRAAESDQRALAGRFGKSVDFSGLDCERNVFRYHLAGTSLRLGAQASSFEQWRSLLALLAVGKGTVSVDAMPNRLAKLLRKAGLKVRIENSEQFAAGLISPARWRLLGEELPVATASNCELVLYSAPVTESGVVELLPYFKEQSVSITAHRFGNPNLAVSQLKI